MVKTKDTVENVKPYVQRAIQDEELRENVVAAFQAAREVYNELMGDRGVTALAHRVASDKDIQDNLRTAVEELRSAADRIQGKDDNKGRNTTLLLVGITLGILFNPMTGAQTRRWLKERIFGPSDEFTYQGNTNSGAGTSTTPTT
jgi:hypothetical protein